MKKNIDFLLFAIINIPQKDIKTRFFPQFRPVRILLPIFGKKKNRNKRLSIGLRKIYSVYKIGDSFIAFLFLFIFYY